MTDFFLRKTDQREPAFDATPEPAAPSILPPAPPVADADAPPAAQKPSQDAVKAAPAATSRPASIPTATGSDGKATARQTTPIFSPDSEPTAEPLSEQEPLAALAELVAHVATPGPLSIGLFGRTGVGKTTALNRLCAGAQALADAARRLPASPFASRLVTIRIDATRCEGEPANAIADAIHHGLTTGGYAELAAEAAHAVRDPVVVARELGEKLSESRIRVDAESRALQELDGRHARLAEAILYETPGSRVDAYSRSNRSRIEGRLRTFGFKGDPVANYKDLVRDVADRQGIGGRIAAFLHATWGFKGQTRLIVFAVLLFILSWALSMSETTGPSWVGWLTEHGGESMSSVTGWLGNHLDWLGALSTLAALAGLGCLLLNLWRALRFTAPILRGAHLLRADEDVRARELAGLISLQKRRLETLVAETDQLSRQAEAAERRAGSESKISTQRTETPFSEAPHQGGTRPAHDFLLALGSAMSSGADDLTAPEKIVVALDSLDDVERSRRAAILQAVQHMCGGRNFATIVAADPAALEDAGIRLDKNFQITLRVDAPQSDPAAWARSFALGATPRETSAPNAQKSRLDEVLSPQEASLLAQLAPLAGESPRAIKRFVNTYRVARVVSPDRAVLALMLALKMGRHEDEQSRLLASLDGGSSSSGMGDPLLASAIAKVEAVRARPLDAATARATLAEAQSFALPA